MHAVARKAGGYPRRLLVREWSVATLLAAELDEHGVEVRVSALRKTERTIHRLTGLLDQPELAWELAPVENWSAVGRDGLEAFFQAAERVWRARPWEMVDDGDVLLARSGGRESAVVLTPPRGHGHVVTLFLRAADYPETFRSVGPVFGLKFTRRDEVAGLALEPPAPPWEPGAAPYPLLLEGGDSEGPSAAQLSYATDLLAAVAALGESCRRLDPGLRFADPESGVELRLHRDSRYVPWPRMRKAGAACATGPGADPAAAVTGRPAGLPARERARVDRFAAHANAATRSRASARHVRHAGEWTRHLVSVAGIPAAAATEYDLRSFLYDRYPRTTREDDADARAIAASLRRYFRYLAEHEGISYPWAAAVFRERAVYVDRLETAPLHHAPDELREWLAPLHADLDARVMLPDRSFPGRYVGWDEPASAEVATLARELLRLWLIWRDEAVREGTVDAGALRARLVARQRHWERTPSSAYGRSPLRIVADAENDAGVV